MSQLRASRKPIPAASRAAYVQGREALLAAIKSPCEERITAPKLMVPLCREMAASTLHLNHPSRGRF